ETSVGFPVPVKTRQMEVETSWGMIAFQTVDGRLVDCTLPCLDEQPNAPFLVKKHAADRMSGYIVAALEGRKRTVPPLGTLAGTDFQLQAWNAISAIPHGETRSYGDLAKSIARPKAFRAVANACGANPMPLFIPCHRVVGANNALGGFSSGVAWKRLLLSAEQ
ncbi:MAG: methylated-DNA--[protein]-cysteine S-methyltransferase, partial [Verrucomicrobiota bacterium]|nr:methylated-DNA--[protein]-cysteine S-methyltransferase [Verrucomicrobiota bacterium]